MKVRQEIELLRVVSAFGIVWCHAMVWGSSAAYAGLACFIIVSVFLAGDTRRPPGVQWLRRLRVLMLPWLLWFVIYGLINVVFCKSFLPTKTGRVDAILSGTQIHLWYLPYMFVVLACVDLLVMATTARTRAHLGAIGAALLLATASLWQPKTAAAGSPWVQYAQASIAVMAGLFAQGVNAIDKRMAIAYLAVLVSAGIAALFVEGVGLPYAVGMPLTLWVLFAAPTWMKRHDFHGAALLTFGIYLVHPPFIWLENKFELTQGLWTPIAAFLASALLVAALRKLLPRVAAVLV